MAIEQSRLQNGLNSYEVVNPQTGGKEVVVEMEEYQPGRYATNHGIVHVLDVDLLPKNVSPDGNGGSHARVKVDLSDFRYGTDNPLRTIEIHHKGLGSQVLGPEVRFWIDFTEEVSDTPAPSYKPTQRWNPRATRPY